MAIKGKTRSKTKSKGHLAGRAPRREPVPVPVPFFLRRWVQLVAVFLLGVGVLAMGVWVTNGLRQDRDEKAAAAAAATRAAALQKWQSEVEVQLGTVAQMQSGSGTLQPPPVSPEVGAAVDALAQGKKPTSKPQDLKKTADALGKAADASRGSIWPERSAIKGSAGRSRGSSRPGPSSWPSFAPTRTPPRSRASRS